MGVGKKTSRKRATGTREHIVAYLAEVHELFDASGMASTRLSAAVGYPGSSVAFAQLLSGMERSGLIEREIRGKRTYRISLGLIHALGTAEAGEPCEKDDLGRSAALDEIDEVSATAAGFDYDELARRLLVQVVRRLAAAEPGAGTGTSDGGRRGASGRRAAVARRDTAIGLEYELASVWAEHGKLVQENVRLREQLETARRSLELAAERLRKLPITADLDRSEVT